MLMSMPLFNLQDWCGRLDVLELVHTVTVFVSSRYVKSQIKAASDFGVPQQTLHRHLENAKNGDGVEKVPGRPRILVRTDEDELVSDITNLEKWLFGPTKIDIRQLAYQY